jgi:hypothetical protein
MFREEGFFFRVSYPADFFGKEKHPASGGVFDPKSE